MLSKEEKAEIIKKHATKEEDTGSLEIQIALLTERIKKTKAHIAHNKKDINTKKRLPELIGRRRHLLSVLKHKDFNKYLNMTLIKE